MKFILTLFVFLNYFQIMAQVGGKGTYSFLNVPVSARTLALGSNFLSSDYNNDPSLAWNNPSILNSKMHQHVSVSYHNYVADINSGFFTYARHFKNKGTFSVGVNYLSMGKFDGYDPAGISTGTFTANDQCFYLAYGNQHKKWSYGASLKYIYSIYESFVSSGVSTDLSGSYRDTLNNLSVTLFARNLGYQVIPYSNTDRDLLKSELAISISKKLEHLPFTYHIVLHNLQSPDFRYNIENTGVKNEFGENKVQTMTMGDNILRHFILGGELNFSKHFVFRFGYDHMKRRELTQEQRKGTSGFGWGLGIKIKKFHFSYGSSTFFPGINANQFSLMTNLSEF
jgi:hypothetical protein